jgi:O-antigen/teichoic acid export membrane protein
VGPLSARRLTDPTNRRRVLVMADQAASSLSNTLVGIFAARALSAEGFGAFGLAWVAYFLVQGACRALVGEVLLSIHSAEDAERRGRRLPEILGATLTVSAVAAVGAAAVGALLEPPSSSALLAFAVVIPVVLVQDTWRFVCIIDRAGTALLLDVVWLVAVCAVLAAAPAGAGAGWFVAAWGLTAAPAVAVAAVADRRFLTWRLPPLRWLSAERTTTTRFFGEYLTAQAGQQLTLAAVSGLAGIAALGAVRASQILYGPLNTIHRGIYMAVVPDGARVRTDPPRLRRLAVRATALVVAAAVAWMVVALALPDRGGEMLFGDSWAEGRDLVLPMGVAMIVSSAATGGFAGVRALGDARASLRARLTSLPGELVLPVLGTWWGGAVGFALGFAAARLVTSAVWWRAFLVHGPAAARGAAAREGAAAGDGTDELRLATAGTVDHG